MSYMLTGKYEEVVQIGNLTLQDKAPEIYILMAYAENKLGINLFFLSLGP